jgi:hypothetical protein
MTRSGSKVVLTVFLESIVTSGGKDEIWES